MFEGHERDCLESTAAVDLEHSSSSTGMQQSTGLEGGRELVSSSGAYIYIYI